MEIKNQTILKFTEAFKKEHGLLLDSSQAGEALQNLADFFALLYQYDLNDRRKLKEREVNKNAS